MQRIIVRTTDLLHAVSLLSSMPIPVFAVHQNCDGGWEIYFPEPLDWENILRRHRGFNDAPFTWCAEEL